MTKVVLEDVTFYQIDLGYTSIFSFNPQELVVRMATMNLSLN